MAVPMGCCALRTEWTIRSRIATSGIIANRRRECQEFTFTLRSDGHDLDIRIYLIADHILDRHQRPGQRARARTASTLISDP